MSEKYLAKLHPNPTKFSWREIAQSTNNIHTYIYIYIEYAIQAAQRTVPSLQQMKRKPYTHRWLIAVSREVISGPRRTDTCGLTNKCIRRETYMVRVKEKKRKTKCGMLLLCTSYVSPHKSLKYLKELWEVVLPWIKAASPPPRPLCRVPAMFNSDTKPPT